MNDLITPPAERDLPPHRATRMRAELLAAARGPRPRAARRRLLAAVAAAVTLVAGVAVTLQVRHEDGTRILAMGPGELDPELRHAADQCLTWYARPNQDPSTAQPTTTSGAAPSPASPTPAPNVTLSLNDIAVASRQGDVSSILFLNDDGYLACDVTMAFGREVSGGLGGGRWPHRDWLPGPVQRLSLSSSESDGGDVAALGRVSSRVHRLILEHGNGHSTAARLSRGTFGLITTTDDVRTDAELVSYDAGGREIDRRRLFRTSSELDHCYTDPAGTVIYGTPGLGCLPADPWTR